MRNPNAKHLDFKELAGLIPGHPKFLPSNLDMMYERRGYFLVCEWKRPAEQFGGGQWILLKSLARTPRFTVLIVTGDTDYGIHISDIQWLKANGELVEKGYSLTHFEDLVRKWFAYVEQKHQKAL